MATHAAPQPDHRLLRPPTGHHVAGRADASGRLKMKMAANKATLTPCLRSTRCPAQPARGSRPAGHPAPGADRRSRTGHAHQSCSRPGWPGRNSARPPPDQAQPTTVQTGAGLLGEVTRHQGASTKGQHPTDDGRLPSPQPASTAPNSNEPAASAPHAGATNTPRAWQWTIRVEDAAEAAEPNAHSRPQPRDLRGQE